eukprot:3406885-Rhodomonas_salina.1
MALQCVGYRHSTWRYSVWATDIAYGATMRGVLSSRMARAGPQLEAAQGHEHSPRHACREVPRSVVRFQRCVFELGVWSVASAVWS